jgi:hypothetical protein
MGNRLAELVTDWISMIQHNPHKLQALARVAQEISRLPYRHFQVSVVACPLHRLPNFQAQIPLEIRLFTAADLDMVPQIHRPSEAQLLARRLAVGHKGLGAWHEGQLIAYTWGCSPVDKSLERVYIELEPGDFLSINNYTGPLFRNKGVQTALAVAQFRMYRDLGYTRAIACIVTNNHPSLSVWHKLGSEVIGNIDVIRVGRLRWARHHAYQPQSDPLTPLSY